MGTSKRSHTRSGAFRTVLSILLSSILVLAATPTIGFATDEGDGFEIVQFVEDGSSDAVDGGDVVEAEVSSSEDEGANVDGEDETVPSNAQDETVTSDTQDETVTSDTQDETVTSDTQDDAMYDGAVADEPSAEEDEAGSVEQHVEPSIESSEGHVVADESEEIAIEQVEDVTSAIEQVEDAASAVEPVAEAEAEKDATPRKLTAQSTSSVVVVSGKAAFIQEGVSSKAVEPVIQAQSSSSQGLSAQSSPNYDGAKAAILAGLQKGLSSIDMHDYSIPITKMGSLYSEVVDANPDFWYVSSAYRYGYNPSTRTVATFMPQYLIDPESSTYKTMRSKYETEMASLLASVPSNAGTVNKIKAVHDWLVLYLTYHSSYANNPSSLAITAQNNPHSAYGALVTKKPVCEGYTLAFMAALKRLGISSTTALNAYACHIWNLVKVSGSWYHVDVTWDDPIGGLPSIAYSDYFLKSDSYLKRYAATSEGYYPAHDRWTGTDPSTSSTPAVHSTTYDNKTWATYLTSASVSGTSATYVGKNIAPTAKVVLGAKVLAAGTDYSVTCKNSSGKVVTSINAAGTYTVSVTGKGRYTGAPSKTAKLIVAKGRTNTLTAKVKKTKVTASYATIKKKALVLASNVTVSNPKGAVTYANVSAPSVTKKFTVNKKTGKVTVLKGTKKGTYTIKIKVTAAGNASYFSGSAIVTYKITVK